MSGFTGSSTLCLVALSILCIIGSLWGIGSGFTFDISNVSFGDLIYTIPAFACANVTHLECIFFESHSKAGVNSSICVLLLIFFVGCIVGFFVVVVLWVVVLWIGDGFIVGGNDGDFDGDFDGDLVGDLVGDFDGDLVGDLDGDLVGDLVGDFDGDFDGDLVGNTGDIVGKLVGSITGDTVGEFVSIIGDSVGKLVGSIAGDSVGDFVAIIGDIVGESVGNTGDIVGKLVGSITGDAVGKLVTLITDDIVGDVVGAICNLRLFFELINNEINDPNVTAVESHIAMYLLLHPTFSHLPFLPAIIAGHSDKPTLSGVLWFQLVYELIDISLLSIQHVRLLPHTLNTSLFTLLSVMDTNPVLYSLSQYINAS